MSAFSPYDISLFQFRLCFYRRMGNLVFSHLFYVLSFCHQYSLSIDGLYCQTRHTKREFMQNKAMSA